MFNKTITSILIVLFTISACAQGFPASGIPTNPPATATPTTMPSGSNGIEGYVTEGPMCPGPVQAGNNTCPDKPYQTTITVFDFNNDQVTMFQTDASGYFKIPLAPGVYTLHPAPGNPLPRASDQTVTVVEDQYTQVTIIYDTGMR